MLACPVPFRQGEYLLVTTVSSYSSFYSWHVISPLLTIQKYYPGDAILRRVLASGSVFYHWDSMVIYYHKDAGPALFYEAVNGSCRPSSA